MAQARIGKTKDGIDPFEYWTYGFGLGWDFGRVLFQLDYAHTDRSPNNCSVCAPQSDFFGVVVGGRY